MMPGITDAELMARATALPNPRKLSPTVQVGSVGCALVSASGTVHIGICIDAACGIGFCAEHAAIAGMVTHGESRIHTIVAVNWEGRIFAPCGRCRELISQIDPGNTETRILLPDGKVTTLRRSLPDHWLSDK